MKKVLVTIFLLSITACDGKNEIKEPVKDNEEEIVSVATLFSNSIVSTNIDFITADDPNAFTFLTYLGLANKEMPDSRNDNLMDTNTFIFEANFNDADIIEIWLHSSFDDRPSAEGYAEKLTSRLGKLPEFMRNTINHVVIHKGDAGAFAEAEGKFFVLYSDNMDVRIDNNDLEETVFHESVHVSLDLTHANNPTWLNAQKVDGTFITTYGENNPNKEDFAESAIFAYTMLKHPGRLSKDIEDWVNTNTPYRLNYFYSVFP